MMGQQSEDGGQDDRSRRVAGDDRCDPRGGGRGDTQSVRTLGLSLNVFFKAFGGHEGSRRHLREIKKLRTSTEVDR
jgi:hypothetical protein